MLYVAIVVYDFCKFSTIFYALRFLSFLPLTFLSFVFIFRPAHVFKIDESSLLFHTSSGTYDLGGVWPSKAL